jgi:hypothetical protein
VSLISGGDDATTPSAVVERDLAQPEVASGAGITAGGTTDAALQGGLNTPVPTPAAPPSATQFQRSAKAVAPAAAPPSVARDVDGRQRQVERAAELELTAKPGDVQEVADGVVRATQAVGGYVARSEIATADDGGGATFTLRVPASRLDEALRKLSALAHVGSLRQSSTDLTGPVSTAAERLSDVRAERKALLKALGRATTDQQIASLRARLRQNRSELAAAKGALQALRRRANLSTVAVTVAADSKAKAPDEGGSWTPGDAVGDAGRVLEVAAGVLLIAAAGLVPIGLLAVLAWLSAKTIRRRRREAVLDT